MTSFLLNLLSLSILCLHDAAVMVCVFLVLSDLGLDFFSATYPLMVGSDVQSFFSSLPCQIFPLSTIMIAWRLIGIGF